MKRYTAVGTMSGTSMDSIDVALLNTDGKNHIEAIASYALPYPMWFHLLLKSAEYAVRQCQGNLSLASTHYTSLFTQFLQNEFPQAIAQHQKQALTEQFFAASQQALSLNSIIDYSTQLHLLAIKELLTQADYAPAQVDVIGYHGQTLFHQPAARITIQVGNGQYLANQLGVTVVDDFRSRDIAHGGQGAPFAPLYHQALAIRDQLLPCAVVNCGGISNITVINGKTPADLLSFDIGPGNGLIDRFIRQRTKGQQQLDLDGQFGLQGTVDQRLLEKLRTTSLLINGKDNFLSLLPPKSLDIADFSLPLDWLDLSLADGCRTLEAFTADCIANALALIPAARPDWPLPTQLILAGGGWYNPVIRQELADRLNGTAIGLVSTEAIGWDNKALEAQIFAYLGTRCLQGLPISFPETTGVAQPLSGGTIHSPG